MLDHLQSDDEYAKFLFNNVKNVTRVYQEKKLVLQSQSGVTTEEEEKKVKISNGFKNMIAKIIREMLIVLSYKIQVYLEGMNNHQIKLCDIKKIIKLWAGLDSVEELKSQFDSFDESVASKI